MNKGYKFFYVFLFLLFSLGLSAQSSLKPPSDEPHGYTYDFNAAKQLIIERQLYPSNENKDAQKVIDSKDFPKLKNKSGLTEEYQKNLRLWMEKNPDIIIETFKSRKNVVQSY